MKIIHTSDWHIGKQLNGFSRIEEQKNFIDDFIETVEEENVDIVVIAGDIYDVTTPSIEAEQLFFTSMERITNKGKRIVVVSAGNHDSSDRLMASRVWGAELGVVIVGSINDMVVDKDINDFKIRTIEEGVFSIEKNGETVKFMNLAYPSETRMNIKIDTKEIEDYSKEYNQVIRNIVSEKSKHFGEDSYNVIIGHFLMFGGISSDSEKEINIGGLNSLGSDILPKSADYVALGHLHKKQKISGHNSCYYSGSPLQYSRSEKDSTKYIGIIDSQNKEDSVVFKELKTYKPIEVLSTDDIEKTIEYIKNNEIDTWYYIEIEQSAIETSKIQALRNASNSILEIIPIKSKINNLEDYTMQNRKEKSVSENFVDYYKFVKNVEPSSDIMKIFLELTGVE